MDGNGDGVKNPQNIYDATLAAGVYLCAYGTDLSTDSGARTAVFGYNHTSAYVAEVMALAHAYATGTAVVPSQPGDPAVGAPGAGVHSGQDGLGTPGGTGVPNAPVGPGGALQPSHGSSQPSADSPRTSGKHRPSTTKPDQRGTPTATPTKTPSSKPGSDSPAKPGPSSEPTATSKPEPSSKPSLTGKPSPTSEASPTQSPGAGDKPSQTPSSDPSPSDSGSPTPSSTPSPSESDSPSSSPADDPVVCQDRDEKAGTLGSCTQGDTDLKNYLCRDPKTDALMRLGAKQDDEPAEPPVCTYA
jgi:hypothetical protein